MPGFEFIGEEERQEVDSVFSRGGGVLFRFGFEGTRNGSFKVRQFEESFAKAIGSEDALAVSSGTAALRVALASLNLLPGDEVITQSFTFVATVEAIIEAGAKPVCTEVDDTLNMDPIDLERRISKNTKAIIVVHMLGVPARLDIIREIATRHQLVLIEDTAWGCGGKFQDRPLGTWGDLATFSFDFAKTLTTGEGGMVIAKNRELLTRARAWHDHGHHNNPSVPRWEDTRDGPGMNYRMTELQGAVGLAQLRKLPKIVAGQRESKAKLEDQLKGLPLELRTIPAGSEETADACVFFVSSPELARACRKSLLAKGLGTKILPEAVSWHFAATWNHMPELFAAHGRDLGSAFPQSSSVLSRAVSLPILAKQAADVPARVREALAEALSGFGGG